MIEKHILRANPSLRAKECKRNKHTAENYSTKGLQGVICCFNNAFNLGHRSGCKGLLRGKKDGPLLPRFSGHGEF